MSAQAFCSLLISSMRVWIVSKMLFFRFRSSTAKAIGYTMCSHTHLRGKKALIGNTLVLYRVCWGVAMATSQRWKTCSSLPHRFIVWLWLNRTVCCPVLIALCMMDGADCVRYMHLMTLCISVFMKVHMWLWKNTTFWGNRGMRASKHVQIHCLRSLTSCQLRWICMDVFEGSMHACGLGRQWNIYK